MRYGIVVSNLDDYADPRLAIRLARVAEEAGWDGVFVWDQVRWREPVVDVADEEGAAEQRRCQVLVEHRLDAAARDALTDLESKRNTAPDPLPTVTVPATTGGCRPRIGAPHREQTRAAAATSAAHSRHLICTHPAAESRKRC